MLEWYHYSLSRQRRQALLTGACGLCDGAMDDGGARRRTLEHHQTRARLEMCSPTAHGGLRTAWDVWLWWVARTFPPFSTGERA